MWFLCLLHVVSVPTMARAGKSAAGKFNEETALRMASPNDGGGARKRTSMMKLEEHDDAPPSGPLEEMRPTPRRGALTSSPTHRPTQEFLKIDNVHPKYIRKLNDEPEEYKVNTRRLWKNEVSQNQMILVMNS